MSRDRSYLHPIGDPITGARRRMLAAQIAAVAGDVTEGGLNLARERLDVLAPRGVMTAALAAFLDRLAGLATTRCPRCLDPSDGLCPPCRTAHAAERELAVQVRTCAAPPADLLELTARLDAGAVVTPAAPPPAPALVLDQIDREELARSCASKGRYPSEVDAKRKARECEAKRGQPLRVYLCWPGCGGWHLTSRLEVPDHVRDRQAR